MLALIFFGPIILAFALRFAPLSGPKHLFFKLCICIQFLPYIAAELFSLLVYGESNRALLMLLAFPMFAIFVIPALLFVFGISWWILSDYLGLEE